MKWVFVCVFLTVSSPLCVYIYTCIYTCFIFVSGLVWGFDLKKLGFPYEKCFEIIIRINLLNLEVTPCSLQDIKVQLLINHLLTERGGARSSGPERLDRAVPRHLLRPSELCQLSAGPASQHGRCVSEQLFVAVYFTLTPFLAIPEGMLGMSDVTLLSAVSGLSCWQCPLLALLVHGPQMV